MCVRVCVRVSADMSPFCSAHYEWLIMKLCMYVGYHSANNVSHFGCINFIIKTSLNVSDTRVVNVKFPERSQSPAFRFGVTAEGHRFARQLSCVLFGHRCSLLIST